MLFIVCVEHNVGDDPGESFGYQEIINRVTAWCNIGNMPTVIPPGCFVIDPDTELETTYQTFVAEHFNHYFDTVSGTVKYLPAEAREVIAGETRDLSEDARLATRDPEVLEAIDRANQAIEFALL